MRTDTCSSRFDAPKSLALIASGKANTIPADFEEATLAVSEAKSTGIRKSLWPRSSAKLRDRALAEFDAGPPRSAQRLVGKVAIVTGVGQRGAAIGYSEAIAVLFAIHGASVILADMNDITVSDTLAQITKIGGSAESFVGDLSDDATCAQLISQAVDRYGKLDILVNNASITGQVANAVTVAMADWHAVMSTNIDSVMLACKYAIPAMKSGGAIVNIASMAAIRAPSLLAYAGSKGAVLSMTTAMAGEHGRQGIRVNCVIPGQVWSPLATVHAHSEMELAAVRQRRRVGNALATEGTSWDIAYAALFLASDEARWITGQALGVDAGASILRPVT